jgi:hypothetical protein
MPRQGLTRASARLDAEIGIQGAVRPLLHPSVSQSSAQPNNSGIAHAPRAMASGPSNHQIASYQAVQVHGVAKAPDDGGRSTSNLGCKGG